MTCQQCNELLDDYLSGMLPFGRKLAFKRHLTICSSCRSNVRDNQIVRQSLQRLGIQRCPDEVVLRVFEILQIEPRSASVAPWVLRWSGVTFRYRWRWALAMAIIIGVIILFSPEPRFRPSAEKQYTAAEIQQAKDQVKFTISWLHQVQTKTLQVLEEKILPDQIVKPLRSSLSTALKPLLSGEKQ
jgi:anti-sigma factor RsiW